MGKTEGNPSGGAGQPCPSPLNIQGEQHALLRGLFYNVPPDLRLGFEWLFSEILNSQQFDGDAAPASKAVSLHPVPAWKGVVIRLVGSFLLSLMASGMAVSVVTHANDHNPDGTHKTIQVQGSKQEVDDFANSGIQKVEGEKPPVDDPPDGVVPECQIRAKSCVYRTRDGRCEATGHPCRMFCARDEIQEIHTEFSGLRRGLVNIEHQIEAVAHHQYELEQENEELRRLNKEGYFNFAVRVKGEDFLAFAVIMALGNRNAAAEHLGIPARTFYSRVDEWRHRGRDYQLMCRYMDWRKRSARHLKVDLNPSLQTGASDGQPENLDTMADVLTEIHGVSDADGYPALLADILQALQRQNSGNWQAVRAELIEIIKAEFSQLSSQVG